jgi:prepilin-type processing-associated H-X9-DG protein
LSLSKHIAILVLHRFAFAVVVLFALALTGRAQLTVTVDRNVGPAATKDFKFKALRLSPMKDDAAAKAILTLLSGEPDPESGDLSVLTDGALPTKETDAKANFFFADGSAGGRFRMDLGTAIDIKQINTYSWHSGTRAPQVYMLYASDGRDSPFCAEPTANIDPVNCGWRLLTTIDTRKNRGDGGGQYVVNITDAHGVIGKYRYLLFFCSAIETEDDFGNTYYSEIDVIAKK